MMSENTMLNKLLQEKDKLLQEKRSKNKGNKEPPRILCKTIRYQVKCKMRYDSDS